LLLGKKLIDYCWLAQSTGWPGFDHFFHSKLWVMVQQKTTVCRTWKFANTDRVWLDFNRTNGGPRGAWNKKGEVTNVAKVPNACNG
jgi:hypothetical protein